MENSTLLTDVVKFKQRFYRSSWARYDTAFPPTFRLVPNEHLQSQLLNDYLAMRPMFLTEPPSWDTLIDELARLEKEINELPWNTNAD